MNRGQVISGGVIGAAGLAVAGVFGWGMGASVHPLEAAAHASTAVPHYTLTIETPDMLGGTEDTGPAYVPANIVLPANTTVEITIVNFDGATELPAGSEQYAKAYGIQGTLAVSDLDAVNPNATKPVRHVKELDPATEVSHTFTVAALGLNVPIAANSVTTFRFHTGLKGSYEWRCMDPCGSGPSGWGAAMSAKGYMEGTMTLA